MKKLIVILMTSVLSLQAAPAVVAKQKGNWDDVKAMINRSVAVKTKTGETHYGLVQSADDAGITIQIAGQDDFTPQEINVQRDDVARVWRATLRFGQRNITKAAWLGAGAGVGVGMAAAAIKGSTGSSDPPTWVALYPFFGAGAGAVAGAFWKKKHKKQELVYSI